MDVYHVPATTLVYLGANLFRRFVVGISVFTTDPSRKDRSLTYRLLLQKVEGEHCCPRRNQSFCSGHLSGMGQERAMRSEPWLCPCSCNVLIGKFWILEERIVTQLSTTKTQFFGLEPGCRCSRYSSRTVDWEYVDRLSDKKTKTRASHVPALFVYSLECDIPLLGCL